MTHPTRTHLVDPCAIWATLFLVALAGLLLAFCALAAAAPIAAGIVALITAAALTRIYIRGGQTR